MRILFLVRFFADFGQFWSKMVSPGPGRASKGFLDALGSILAKYQPKRSHGDPFQLNFDIFWTTIFVKTNSFSESRSPVAPQAKPLR